MSKNILGNEITYDVWGNPLTSSKNKRQSVAKSQKNRVFDHQSGKCYFCKKRLKLAFTHFDHIKEVHKGGKSITDNLRAVCANCHYERHNKDKANKVDKSKKKSTSDKKYWINPLTGQKEQANNIWGI